MTPGVEIGSSPGDGQPEHEARPFAEERQANNRLRPLVLEAGVRPLHVVDEEWACGAMQATLQWSCWGQASRVQELAKCTLAGRVEGPEANPLTSLACRVLLERCVWCSCKRRVSFCDDARPCGQKHLDVFMHVSATFITCHCIWAAPSTRTIDLFGTSAWQSDVAMMK
eukprot:jgi/Bigna1/72186/fgenesh1_pg.18_\